MAERTGCPVLLSLWSYVLGFTLFNLIYLRSFALHCNICKTRFRSTRHVKTRKIGASALGKLGSLPLSPSNKQTARRFILSPFPSLHSHGAFKRTTFVMSCSMTVEQLHSKGRHCSIPSPWTPTFPWNSRWSTLSIMSSYPRSFLS
jgi:hypothetical protein